MRARGEVLDADGDWAVPGLWDNHVHTVQWALETERLSLADARSAAEAAHLMHGASVLADGRRVGSGFRDALWPDQPSLEILDTATGVVPTYLINADVHSVWLNSAALEREGYRSSTGVLRETDAFEISRRLNAVDPAHGDRAVTRAGERAAARGVTGLVDFDMAWNAEAWPRRLATGFAAHRVEFAVYPFDLDRAIASGLRTGEALDDVSVPVGTGDLVHMGPLKVISDGSLGTRTAACSHAYPGDGTDFGTLTVPPEELTALLTRAAGAGLAVAVHAIGDRATTSALDAFTISGAAGTIEHAQLVRHADLARFARLGVIASVQPQHALDDRDLVGVHWAGQTGISHPLASLLNAGAILRFGSDAPVAALDPWQAIAAAVARTDGDREAWHPEERLTLVQALEASVRTSLRPGEPADIVLCGEDPARASVQRLREMPVAATLLAGRITYAR
ncbi:MULTISPECIES: amidohydrolase [unclassified Microbacterium]|uniref:amidohydrolase n=1 Tax=unclassified Microbacterium TaxID=2609290 RepID=UPI000EAA0155|nr:MULTISPECIES: amidohydrolase family protein [unclassified Microbacterium]MBT2485851.1 amidohydrolase family protein [Microbacterium sp. ISL-108]RKN69633.1 metal-dependent hydrolase [Microbacterium sp. CGR2]